MFFFSGLNSCKHGTVLRYLRRCPCALVIAALFEMILRDGLYEESVVTAYIKPSPAKNLMFFTLLYFRQPKKEKATKAEAPADDGPKYGPTDKREGEHVFAVAHIFASFNDTFVVCTHSIINVFVNYTNM